MLRGILIRLMVIRLIEAVALPGPFGDQSKRYAEGLLQSGKGLFRSEEFVRVQP